MNLINFQISPRSTLHPYATLNSNLHCPQIMQTQSADQQCKIQELQDALHLERDNLSTALARQSSLDSTKAHLQKQLKTKESDCNRMAVQIHVYIQ